jgi:hypothetical protein
VNKNTTSLFRMIEIRSCVVVVDTCSFAVVVLRGIFAKVRSMLVVARLVWLRAGS